jgi:AraC-like DNA-binding protein
MLDDKKYNNLTILGIAFDCGFNSKSTFNSVFKQFTGLTPSGYKKGAIK